MNDLCYNYEKIKNFNEPIFKSVDSCYVIILNNSKYEDRVRNQLKEYCLCKNMLLQWNKGFKNCTKIIPRQITISDLTDSFLTILHNAIINDYNNILILEEDFIINKRIREEKVKNDLNNFIINYNPDILLLGSILWESTGNYNGFVKVGIKTGTHAIIINRETINKLYYQIKNSEDVTDIDILTNNLKNKFAYKIPVIIQVFSSTENQKNWGEGLIKNNLKRKISVFLFLIILRIIGFDDVNRIDNAYQLNYNYHFKNSESVKKITNYFNNKIYNFLYN